MFYGLEKGVRCLFVSHRSPKNFLIVQFRMVGREIVDVQLTMSGAKAFNPLASMPPCPVDPEVDKGSLEASNDTMQHVQQAIGIPFRPLHHAMQPLKGGHPAKEIQSFLMLTARPHVRFTPLFRPHPAQFRMQREARLIFKNDHPSFSASFHGVKFFLTLAETLLPLPRKLEQTDTPVVAANSPISGSTAGHAERVSSSDETASDTPPGRPRPTERGGYQNPSEIWIRRRPAPCSTLRRTGKDDRGGSGPVSLLRPTHSPSESTSPRHSDSNRRDPLSGRIATPSTAANRPLCESLSMRLESHLPSAAGIPPSCLCASALMLSSFSSRKVFIGRKYSTFRPICKLILVVYYNLFMSAYNK